MGGFNLPPGCSVSDIPGNRPEDEAEERFWDHLAATFAERWPWEAECIAKLGDTHPDLQEAIDRYAETARDIGYSAGYDEGGSDAALARFCEEEARS